MGGNIIHALAVALLLLKKGSKEGSYAVEYAVYYSAQKHIG